VLTFQDDDSNVMFSRAAKNENNSHDSLFDSISSHNQLGKSKKYTLKTKNGKFGKNEKNENNSPNSEKIKINNQIFYIRDIEKLNIFIQMELCKETLADYLSKRQETIVKILNNMSNSKNINNINNNNNKNTLTIENQSGAILLSQKEVGESLKIFFSHVCRAIQFIHDKEKIIHRDLKPTNIFISEDSNVKVGDFGLATELFNLKYKKLSMCEDFSSTSELTFSRKNSIVSSNSDASYNSFLSYHTKNIGTPQYASPEQLSDNFYDQKSDIYSLGLVLLELVYPLKTGMEKVQIFKELKENGKLPEIFVQKYQNLSTLILDMTSKISTKRPEAYEILLIVNSEIQKKIEKKSKIINDSP